MKNIRLPEEDIQFIIKAFCDTFGPDDSLWIFGSRVDMNRRGGDIDLYVETLEPTFALASDKRSDFIWRLWKDIGEQKIDVVLNVLSSDVNLPIYNIAKKEGVKLV